jgi:hypothetical protein
VISIKFNNIISYSAYSGSKIKRVGLIATETREKDIEYSKEMFSRATIAMGYDTKYYDLTIYSTLAASENRHSG